MSKQGSIPKSAIGNQQSAIRPWYAVATPHEDIQKGRLSEAVFAANLWAVMNDSAPAVYTDTDAFFAKTYLTGGLTRVLKTAASALSSETDAGDRILSLQTAFGGGKTHALVALWHLAKHPKKIANSAACADLRAALGDSLPKHVTGVAVFTNQTCDAAQGRKTDQGVRTHTLWGELALQLGGKDLYERIRSNDEGRIAPKGLFVDILKAASPCLILLDEVADYCVAASAVRVEDSTLADQTVSFVQELTEAAQQVPHACVVATLPASHLEVASSEKGQELLNRLEKRFGRMSADNTPVADNEIYEVVRRRLFESLGEPADHAAIAEAYVQMYQQHRNEVPTEATRATYKESLIAAYPFHPSLIDALYLRWGSHGDFQRTRGVLRLLASVVADLWQRRKSATESQFLIQPCQIRWTIDALHAALTRLWGAQYESVVAHDVVGRKANASLLDEERGGEYTTERLTEGLAAAVLLGSFGGKADRSGYSTKDIKLCVGRPGLNWGYTDGALLAFDERAFYLHTASAGSQGKRYWFGTKPTLNKLIVQYRAQMSSQSLEQELIETVQQHLPHDRGGGAMWKPLVDPQPDLPEQKALVLLIMPPDCVHSENGGQTSLLPGTAEERIMSLSQRCGKKERYYRNTLLFLLPSSRGVNRLRNALLEVEVLSAVQRDYAGQLEEEQKADLKTRLSTAQKTVVEAVGGAYTHLARIEGHELTYCALTDMRASFGEHLEAAWRQVVEDEEWVLRRVGGVTLQKAGLIPESGGITIKNAVETFLRFTDKPMIAARQAVLDGLAVACREKLIGVARGLTLEKIQRKWCGEDVSMVLDEEGMWIIPPFTAEEKPKQDTGDASAGTTTTTPTGETGAEKKKGQETPTVETVSRVHIHGNVSLDNWSELFRCFISPAARMNMKKLNLTVDFDMTPSEDQPVTPDDPAVKAMKEAASQLGLDFETEQ